MVRPSDRWAWARERNTGWRLRNIVYAVLVGGFTWLVLWRMGRWEAAVDQLIGLGVLVALAFVLIPAGELIWDAFRAGGVLRDAELSRLASIVESLATTKGETATDRYQSLIRMFQARGEELLAILKGEPNNKQARADVFDWLQDARAALAMYGKQQANMFMGDRDIGTLKVLHDDPGEIPNLVETLLARLQTLLDGWQPV